MLRLTDIVHLSVRSRLAPGAIAVDATVGNGHDTLMLADAIGPTGRVFGFDVQADALARTRVRLGARGNVTLFAAGHERMAEHLPAQVHGHVAAVLFNLGYLPGTDKSISTQAATTVTALAHTVPLLAVGGLVTLVLYRGHEGGADEAAAVRAAVGTLPSGFAVHHTVRLDSATPAPELVCVERVR